MDLLLERRLLTIDFPITNHSSGCLNTQGLVKFATMEGRFNKVSRGLFRSWHWLHKNMHRYVLDHIRVNGSVNVQIEDLHLRLYSREDDGIVDALYFNQQNYGEYEEVNLFKNLAKKSDVIFDVGANTGLYSIVSQLSNPEASVYAFEPYPVNLQRLEKNAELNRVEDKINVVQTAIGDSQSKLRFAIPETAQVCDVLSADIEFTEQFTDTYDAFKTVQVAQTTLDDFVRSRKIPGVDLIKIDVENFELNVLKGGLDSLETFKPVILAEMFVDDERIRFFKEYLQPLGYSCYLIGKKGLFRTNELVDNPDCRNYLFSCRKSKEPYLSFSKEEMLVQEIIGSAA